MCVILHHCLGNLLPNLSSIKQKNWRVCSEASNIFWTKMQTYSVFSTLEIVPEMPACKPIEEKCCLEKIIIILTNTKSIVFAFLSKFTNMFQLVSHHFSDDHHHEAGVNRLDIGCTVAEMCTILSTNFQSVYVPADYWHIKQQLLY